MTVTATDSESEWKSAPERIAENASVTPTLSAYRNDADRYVQNVASADVYGQLLDGYVQKFAGISTFTAE